MSEINAAYAKGDEHRIRQILSEWHASPESVSGEGVATELIRLIRKIAQVERRLSHIAQEITVLQANELFELKKQVDDSLCRGQDLLNEMCEELDRRIDRAEEELDNLLRDDDR